MPKVGFERELTHSIVPCKNFYVVRRLSVLARRMDARGFFRRLLNEAPHLISNVQVTQMACAGAFTLGGFYRDGDSGPGGDVRRKPVRRGIFSQAGLCAPGARICAPECHARVGCGARICMRIWRD